MHYQLLVLTTELASFDKKPVKPARAPPDEFSAVSGIEFRKDLRNSSLTLLSFLALGVSPAALEELGKWKKKEKTAVRETVWTLAYGIT